jgi:hypothetical protein
VPDRDHLHRDVLGTARGRGRLHHDQRLQPVGWPQLVPHEHVVQHTARAPLFVGQPMYAATDVHHPLQQDALRDPRRLPPGRGVLVI